MKVVNKIMIGIAVLCLLLCGGILVFALNPNMTSSLAQKLYGNTVDMPPGTEETGEGQTSGNGNISVTLPNGDRKSTRLNSSHVALSRMPSSA